MYLGKIASIIEDSNAPGVNADVNGDFYLELQQLCSDRELTISDVALLPGDSYTHVNNGNLTRSWLDHCVTSLVIHAAISNIHIDNDYTGSDHFPLHIDLKCDALPQLIHTGSKGDKINWNFQNNVKLNEFYGKLTDKLTLVDNNHLHCNSKWNMEHRQRLEEGWNTLVDAVRTIGKDIFGLVKSKRRCVSGWNEYVREFYDVS